MDSYQLGYTKRGQGITIGTQHTFYSKATGVVPKAEETEPAVDPEPSRNNGKAHGLEHAQGHGPKEEGEGPRTSENRPGKKRDSEGGPPNGPPEGKRVKQEHSETQDGTGDEVTTPHQKDTGDAPEKRDEKGSVRAEQEQSTAEQEDQQTGKAGTVRDDNGTAGSSSGPLSTSGEGSATGGDGHAATSSTNQE